MKSKNITLMSLATILGTGLACTAQPASPHPQDKLNTRDGSTITLTFFKHASLAIEREGKHIYIDPVSSNADYASLPKADLVLITHSHGDHLDSAAIAAVSDANTRIVCDKTSAKGMTGDVTVMTPGMTAQPRDYVALEAVAAYNTSEGHLQFHPREREDVGYILTIGSTRIYIAGDSENTDEMKALRNIDIAFLPVNQPYTMTVDQAVDAVRAIRPTIFYPYHYGEVEQATDINRLAREVKDLTEVRIRPME